MSISVSSLLSSEIATVSRSLGGAVLSGEEDAKGGFEDGFIVG